MHPLIKIIFGAALVVGSIWWVFQGPDAANATYLWVMAIDGIPVTSTDPFFLPILPAGSYVANLTVTFPGGCVRDHKISFKIDETPIARVMVSPSSLCVSPETPTIDVQLDGTTSGSGDLIFSWKNESGVGIFYHG